MATIPALVIFVPIQGRHFVEGFSDLQASIGQPFLESLISTTGSPLTLLILVAVGAAALTAVVRWLLEAAPVFAASVTTAAFVLGVIAGPVDRIYRFKRITVVFWPLVIVFVAYAIYRGFSKSVSRLVQISLVALSIIASLLTLFVVEKDDWRSAVSAINEGSDPDDSIWMVYYVGEWSVAPYDYYGRSCPFYSASTRTHSPNSQHRRPKMISGSSPAEHPGTLFRPRPGKPGLTRTGFWSTRYPFTG